MKNGAETLVETLLEGGVNLCLANPGTSEMQFVAALDKHSSMRCVLGLFEGVVTGAADGYGRMTDRPAATLLHLGPGLANGLANLHNARRAQSPVLNIVGEHATWHLDADPPLYSDIEGLARPMSDWVRSSSSAQHIKKDTEEAIAVASSLPGKIATLILPADTAWTEVTAESAAAPVVPPAVAPRAGVASEDRLAAAAQALQSGLPVILVLSGRALRSGALENAGRIAARTGARLISQYANGRIERGAGRVAIERWPYSIDQGVAFFREAAHVILVGAKAPVAFFANPGKPSSLLQPNCNLLALTAPEDDIGASLAALAERVGAARSAVTLQPLQRPALPDGALTPEAVQRIVGALMPEHAIIVDESVSAGRSFFQHTRGCVPHDYLQLTGGAIGSGLPMATGAAIACPTRKVISLEGDGSSMYTIQALWTQARERLDVLTIIFANKGYQVLRGELLAVGVERIGEQAERMLSMTDPEADWVKLAEGMGVEAARAETVADLIKLMRDGLSRPGPYLIEARIAM